MNVSDLIRTLQEFPPDTLVVDADKRIISSVRTLVDIPMNGHHPAEKNRQPRIMTALVHR